MIAFIAIVAALMVVIGVGVGIFAGSAVVSRTNRADRISMALVLFGGSAGLACIVIARFGG